MATNGWKKGQSGNPGGRTKDSHMVRDLARQHTPEALETLVELMRNGRQENTRMGAAIALLDRGWGKPAQSITGSDDPDDAPVRLLING